MKKVITIAILLAVSGCASSMMQGYVGQSIQQVVAKQRPPDNIFDMGDGRRAFQWIKTETTTTPVTATNYGQAYGSGNSIYWTQNSRISGGEPITNSCTYTVYSRWNGTVWIVEGFEKPNIMCE